MLGFNLFKPKFVFIPFCVPLSIPEGFDVLCLKTKSCLQIGFKVYKLYEIIKIQRCTLKTSNATSLTKCFSRLRQNGDALSERLGGKISISAVESLKTLSLKF